MTRTVRGRNGFELTDWSASRVRTTGPGALPLLALGMLVFLLVAAGAGPGSLPARTASVLRGSGTPGAPTPRNLTLYMHNNTLAENVNGISTPYLFDTLQKYGGNNTVSNIGRVRQDWYLFPALAGPLAVNGTISAHMFFSVVGATLSATPTVTVSEINATGVTVYSISVPGGARPWWTTPHDLTVTTGVLTHTFAAGSTILVMADIVVGASSTGTIWYNASWVPSHLVIQSDDFAKIDTLAFLDSTGTPRTSFDPLAANKDIDIIVSVTDPLGGYDVHWVNLTLQRPGGAFALKDAALAKTAGTPVSYVSKYHLVWNYSGQPVGRYNATAGVLDNSGYFYFVENFAEDGFRDQMVASFYIGGLASYVNVEAVDSKMASLNRATVDLLTGGVVVDAVATDSNGLANLTMAQGTYEFRVIWQSVLVASVTQDVSSNVSAASPLVIATQVYYPIFRATDADGRALGGASLLFVHPNGAKLGPYETNASGEVTLDQVPVGTYGILAAWRGVDVFSGSEMVQSNGVISFMTAVYELTVTAKSGDGQTLAGVFVSVTDSTGLVFDAGITGAQGTVILRLPSGAYTVNARFVTAVGGTFYDSGVRSSNVSLTSSTSTTVTFADYPIPFTSTLEFQFGLAYAITVAALLVALFFLWRRKKVPATAPIESEKQA
ncbi:MAG TPA: hypothetical protein VK189_05815 [Thermoplasmata archaeon]|nr:hypothetical protein [Thermoplasmata archaeon]